MVSHSSESAFVFQGTWKALKPAVDFGKTTYSRFEEKRFTHLAFGLKIAAEMQTARVWPNIFLSLRCRSRTLPVLGLSCTKVSHKIPEDALTAPLSCTGGTTAHDFGHSYLQSSWPPFRDDQGRCWITVCCPKSGELKANSAGVSQPNSFLLCAPWCIPSSRVRPLFSSSL